jgi:hypothetical protein
MARTFYDSLDLNTDIQLDLAMLEATGSLIHDESRNHSMATIQSSIGAPLWQQTALSHFGLQLNAIYPTLATNHFVDIPAADCINLDFTSTDYSLAVWFNWSSTSLSQIIMGKYITSVSGWEVYLFDTGAHLYLTVRHHHAASIPVRTASYSDDWVYSEWHLFSYTRTGTTAQHYRDGEPITTVSDVLIDPESSLANDLRIGCRYTENADWFKGKFHRPRAWSRALTADEHRLLFRLGYP